MKSEEEVAATILGTQAAIGSALRALISTHPDQEVIAAALRFEHQETLAHLTAMTVPDRTLESFHQMWAFFGPMDEGAPTSE